MTQKHGPERPPERCTVCDSQCLRHHMFLTYCEKTQGFFSMYHVDRGYADEQKRRTARPKWVILFKFIVFRNVFAFVFQAVFIGNLFFATFHLGGACTTFRGWWTRVLHWGDATVHARGISRELALWSSLWKSLSIGSAHFSLHGATAYPTAACPLCELDLFCAWTLHGSVWPQPNPNPTPYPT